MADSQDRGSVLFCPPSVFGRDRRDHGHFRIHLTELALDATDNPQRPLAVHAAAQSEYARLPGMPVSAVKQAMKTWLPVAIVRYFLLMGGPTRERWRRMMQRAEAALRPPV